MPPPGRRPATPTSDGRATFEPLTPEAFAARLQACSSVLWTAATGILGDRSAAEDVAQDAALIGLRKLDHFDPATNFVAWMGRIVRNVALNQARLAQRRQTHATDGALLDQHPAAAEGTTPLARQRLERAADDPEGLALDGLLLDDELTAALAGLRPIARACLLLKTVLDLEYREISAVLDVPEGTAMSHVHRARRLLREQLAGRVPSRGAAEDTTTAPVEPRR